MIKKMRVAVDHGNRNMKTCSHILTTGLTVLDKKPARGEEYLYYDGKYYTPSQKRIPYQRDKTADSRFFVLTLMAIAKELEAKQVTPDDIVQIDLPIGLPPKHFSELYEKYESYFLGNGKVISMVCNGKPYHICIKHVRAFPQDYAAMVRLEEIGDIPKAVGIDIGGFTTDFLLMRNGKADMACCDSMEMGVIMMCNDIISRINSEYDIFLEESDVESIIRGKTAFYPDQAVAVTEEMAGDFVTDLLASIRERGVDTRAAYTVFIGGGALLLRRFLERSDRLEKYLFVDDLCANAKGYDMLYRMLEDRK